MQIPDPWSGTLPGIPMNPLPPMVPLDPNGPSPENAPMIDFVPASAPTERLADFEIEYQGRFVWQPIPIIGEVDFVVVAQRPDSTAQIALVDDEGGVWISNDRMISTRQTLPGIGEVSIGDDGNIVDIDDVLSNVDIEAIADNESFQDEEEVADQAQQIQQELEDAREAMESDDDEDDDGDINDVRATLTWVDGVLFVGRSDGLYRSEDGGSSFREVLNLDAGPVIRTALGFVVGTKDGARYSGDGVSWIDLTDGTEGLAVQALANLNGPMALLASDQGLYQTLDGFQWTQRATLEDPMLSMALDPDLPGRIWVGTERRLLSSDDMGASFQAPLNSAVPRTVALERLGTLHWMAASRDGVWETLNGGLSWKPLVFGLQAPVVTSLSAEKGTILCTAGGVVHRLVGSEEAAVDDAQLAQALREADRDFIPRGALLDAALGRPELLMGSGSSALAYALPRVTVNAYQWFRDGVLYDSGRTLTNPTLDDGAGTNRNYDRFFQLAIELRWAPPGKKASVVGGAVGAVTEADVGVDLTLDEGVDGSSPKAIAYQADIARRVNELVSQRAEVVAQRIQVRRQPLMQQVFLEIAIQEIEADLDVYTNGAVFEWKRSMAGKPAGGSP